MRKFQPVPPIYHSTREKEPLNIFITPSLENFILCLLIPFLLLTNSNISSTSRLTRTPQLMHDGCGTFPPEFTAWPFFQHLKACVSVRACVFQRLVGVALIYLWEDWIH